MASSVVYDIFISPIKLESPGIALLNRYAVMGDYRGGKRVPLNPASPAMQSPSTGIPECNWPLRSDYQFPFQIPFTQSKHKKEFQLQILDGGPVGNNSASASNSKVVGELIINVGNYCNVLDQECCNRLVEVAFKMQGKPAILSLQLLMVPHGIPAQSVDATPDLVQRASGGSGMASAAGATSSGARAARPITTVATAGRVPTSRPQVASTDTGGARPSGRSNVAIISVEQLSMLLSLGAIDDSVWVASNGCPIEVDSDIAGELLAHLTRYEEATLQGERLAKSAAAAGVGNNQHAVSNYESQTGPVGEAVFTARTQRSQHEKVIIGAVAKSLQKQLDEGRKHARALAPSNNDVFAVDTTRTFVARNNTTASSGGSVAEQTLVTELNTLDMHMAQLEIEQKRRDVTADVCYVLERRATVEDQLNAIRANAAKTQQQQGSGGAGSLLGGESGLDERTQIELLQELAATERAIELLEWKRRARAQLRNAFVSGSPADPSASFASLQASLEPPLPINFPKLPAKKAAGGGAAAGANDGFDEFGFPIVGTATAAAKGVATAASQHLAAGAAKAQQVSDDWIDLGAPGAAKASAMATAGVVATGAAALGVKAALQQQAAKIPFGGGSGGVVNDAKTAVAIAGAGMVASQAQQQAASAFDDFFGGPTVTAAKTTATGAMDTATQQAAVMGQQAQVYGAQAGQMAQQAATNAAATAAVAANVAQHHATNAYDNAMGILGGSSSAPPPMHAGVVSPPNGSTSTPPPAPAQTNVGADGSLSHQQQQQQQHASTGMMGSSATSAAVPPQQAANASNGMMDGGMGFSGGSSMPPPQHQQPATPIPPAAPAPSKWLADKPMAWGADPVPSPTPQLMQASANASASSAAAASIPQPAATTADAHSNNPNSSNSGGYAQPQWQAPHSLQNATTSAVTSPTNAAPTNAYQQQQQAAVPPQQQQQAQQQQPHPAANTDLFGQAFGGISGMAGTFGLPQPAAPAPQQQQAAPQAQQQQQPPAMVSPPPAPPAAAQQQPPAVVSPLPQQQQQQQQMPPPPQQPSLLSKADPMMCTYSGNLFSQPIARVSFDEFQHLIIQKEVGNITIIGGGSGGGSGEEKRNGIIIRFAGGMGAGGAPPTTRGISGVLKALQWNITTDDMFSPVPVEVNAVVIPINNGKPETFGMKLPTTNPEKFFYALEPASINELKPYCRSDAPNEERAIMVWPVKRGVDLGNLTMTFAGVFTANGGAPMRRSIPIRF